MDTEKIFCIGFHKTGTSSLCSALRKLGFRTVHGDSPNAMHGGDEGRGLLPMIQAGNFDLPTLPLYDAFADNPYFSIWMELAKRHPRARFILTSRPEEEWLASCVAYYRGRRVRPMREWMFGAFADPSLDAESADAWLEAYRKHNREIREYFAKSPTPFLDFSVFRGDGWERLCPFLGVPIPKKDFPHKNTGPRATDS